MWVFLPDSPTTAWWLTERQRVIATRRTQSNHTGMENKSFKMYQVVEALTDPKTWYVLGLLCHSFALLRPLTRP